MSGVLGPGRRADVLDHLYELVAAVAVTPGELHEVTGAVENGAAAGGSDDGDPSPAAEFNQAFVAQQPQRAEHRIAVHVQHGRKVAGGREPLARADLAVGDRPADFRAHLFIEGQRILPVNLDTSHDDNQTSTMKGDTRTSTIKSGVPPSPVPVAEGDVEAQILIKEARERARRRRRRGVLALVGLLAVAVGVFAAVRSPSGGAPRVLRDKSTSPPAAAPAAAPAVQPPFFADTQGSGEGNGPLQVRDSGTGQVVWQDERATSADDVTGLAAAGPAGFVIALNAPGGCATQLYRVRLNSSGRPDATAPVGPTLPGTLWSLAVGDGGQVIGYAISGCSKDAPGYLGVLQVSSGRTRQWGGMSLGGVSSGNLALQGPLSVSANGRLLAFAAAALSQPDGLITARSVRVLTADAPPGSVAERSRVVYREAARSTGAGLGLAAAILSSSGKSVYLCLQSATRTEATAQIVAYGITGTPRTVVTTFTAHGTWPQVTCSSMALDTSGRFLLVPYSLRNIGRPGSEMIQQVARISLATRATSTVSVEMPGSGTISQESGMSIVAW